MGMGIETMMKHDNSLLVRWIFIGVLVSISLIGLGISTVGTGSTWRPNIIYIQTDDMTYSDLYAKLPNGEYAMKNVLRLIGRGGVAFTNAHDSFPLCCPARSTFFTGKYAHNHSVLTNFSPTGGFTKLNHANTLPVWLQQAGYYTAHFGKYMNGYTAAMDTGSGSLSAPRPSGWSDWFTLVEIGGTSPGFYYNYDVHDNNSFVHYGNAPADYLTDILTNRVIQDLSTKPYGNAPFFMQVDYFAPHGQPVYAVPATRHSGMMSGMTAPRTASFNEADVSDKPQDVRNRPLLSSMDIANLDLRYQKRIEALLSVDEGVARMVRTLQYTNQYDNTIIIFTSDNGWMQGANRIPMGKDVAYAGSTHVPLLMIGPRIPSGHVISNLVANVDYAPTIIEWTHSTAGLSMDGRSLFPLLQNAQAAWRTDLLMENPLIKYYSGVHTQDRAANTEYVYVEYDYNLDGVYEERELYNLTPDACRSFGDPDMLESQHNNPCYATLLAQLHTRLMQLKTCSGVTCQ